MNAATPPPTFFISNLSPYSPYILLVQSTTVVVHSRRSHFRSSIHSIIWLPGHFGVLNIEDIHPFGSDLKSFIQFLHLSLHLLTLFPHLNSVSLQNLITSLKSCPLSSVTPSPPESVKRTPVATLMKKFFPNLLQ